MAYIDAPKSVLWLTPPGEVENVVVPVLGSIDHDPCSHALSLVPALHRRYGTSPEDDGLSPQHEWSGNVFLNPPWSEKPPKGQEHPQWHGVGKWLDRLVAGFDSGAIKSALAVLPACPDRTWFARTIYRRAARVCFLLKRIRFYEVVGDEAIIGGQPGQAHMYVLWSRDAEVLATFDRVLEPRGIIAISRNVEPAREPVPPAPMRKLQLSPIPTTLESAPLPGIGDAADLSPAPTTPSRWPEAAPPPPPPPEPPAWADPTLSLWDVVRSVVAEAGEADPAKIAERILNEVPAHPAVAGSAPLADRVRRVMALNGVR